MSSDWSTTSQEIMEALAATPLSNIEVTNLRKSNRSKTPNPSSKSSSQPDDDSIQIKRPRTPSSVPPIPVSSRLEKPSSETEKPSDSLKIHCKMTGLAELTGKSSTPRELFFKQFEVNEDSVSSDKNMKGCSANDQPQQFCLKWNSYQTNLKSEFDQLLQNESFVDVTLACDGHSIKAHKMVLSACSPYFQALFFDNPCQHPIIIMKEVKWPELKAVVEYMYKGEINVCQDQIEPLLRVAQMLKIRGLADVEQYITPTSSPPSSNSKLDSKLQSKKSPNPTKSESLMSPAKSFNEPHQRKSSRSSREFIDINDNISGNVFSRKNDDKNMSENVRGAGEGASDSNNLGNLQGSLVKQDRMESESPISLTLNQSQQNRTISARKRRWLTGGSDTNSTSNNTASPGSEIGQVHNRTSTPENNDSVRSSPSALLSSIQNPTMLLPHGHQPPSSNPIPFPLPQSALESMGLSSLGLANTEDMEIKPGIAEMIREEERAKLLENSHAWLGASTSSIADSYQYQLQSMWQKCWNTNQNIIHHLRFRERGPLKSWRPETMAEAIFSVLKEGLSLSQAARKYDIPYPTFVLYANRVHNMLGPSIDGGTDLRPKGRGRPQRILLGIWPDDHIRGVIKTVVFRDAKELKDEVGMGFDRHSDGGMSYPGSVIPNGMAAASGSGQSGSDITSDAAAAVAAVAQGIRQQMQMVAAAQHHPDAANLVGGLNHLNMYPTSSNGGSANNIPMPKIGSPATSALAANLSHSNRANDLANRNRHSRSPSSLTRLNSPNSSVHDLRMQSPDDNSSLNSSLEMALEPAVNLAVGVSGYKPRHPLSAGHHHRGGYSPSTRPEHFMSDDISELVANRSRSSQSSIKLEPIAECRGD